MRATKKSTTAPTLLKQENSSSSSSHDNVNQQQDKYEDLKSCMDAIKFIPDELLYESEGEEDKDQQQRQGQLIKEALSEDKDDLDRKVTQLIQSRRLPPPPLAVYRTTPECIETYIYLIAEIAFYRLQILQILCKENWISAAATTEDFDKRREMLCP